MSPLSLENARKNTPVTVRAVGGGGALRRRIMDMGITRGTVLKITGAAPLGDPIQVSLRGYSLSLRKSDAALIEVAAVTKGAGA